MAISINLFQSILLLYAVSIAVAAGAISDVVDTKFS